MSDQLTCAGCGVEVQTEDPKKAGFLPSRALERDIIVCQRCFRITHYNEIAPVDMDNKDYKAILKNIANENALVVMMIDLFDVAGSWIKGIDQYIGRNPVLLAANKIDLFPLTLTEDDVKKWIINETKSRGFHPVDVVPISAKKGYNMEELVEAIEAHRAGRNVYVIGSANVGKSTMINRLIRDYGDGLELELTTSPYPGTTLQTVTIPLDDGKALIDTPGIVNERMMNQMIAPSEIPDITPTKSINPVVYQLNDQQSLFIGGLARIDFVQGERQSFVFYTANQLTIHRTKLENADALYEKHKGEMLQPPGKETLSTFPPFKKHTFKIKPGEEKDIVISGLGWVAIKGTGATVDVHAPEGVHVSARPCLI